MEILKHLCIGIHVINLVFDSATRMFVIEEGLEIGDKEPSTLLLNIMADEFMSMVRDDYITSDYQEAFSEYRNRVDSVLADYYEKQEVQHSALVC